MEPWTTDQQVQVIEARLDALDALDVSDDQSARDAYTHLMTTVSRINQLTARTQAQAMMGAGAPVDEVLEKLRQWLDRMLGVLKRIVENLAGATSFSVSVSTAVSVTVDFGNP
ncbi:MAG TPA: hypothetical protein VME19_11520 [Streptosporangiaceae bacterium]|nr:hypothetical protein [Streptosporangiaceae bacterium]